MYVVEMSPCSISLLRTEGHKEQRVECESAVIAVELIRREGEDKEDLYLGIRVIVAGHPVGQSADRYTNRSPDPQESQHAVQLWIV